MKTRALAVAAIVALSATARAAAISSPSEFLGMKVGAARTVADYRQILAYFQALDAASPRVEVEILGKSTLGEDLFLAAISSEANLANRKRLQEIARGRSLTRGGSRRRPRCRTRLSWAPPPTGRRSRRWRPRTPRTSAL